MLRTKIREKSTKRAAIFGNFYSWTGEYKAPCEELSDNLEKTNWKIIRSSFILNRVLKLVDMVKTAWVKRNSYYVAVVEVYSGLAFIWAEIVGFVLRIANKPYVLVLHGGNLPEFSNRWSKRVKRLFNPAKKVIVPSRYLLESMSAFRNDIVLIPNSIYIDRYTFKEPKKVVPSIVWLRAFKNLYNPTLAVKVLNRLVSEGTDAYLTMIGPDKGDGSLQKTEALSKELRLENRLKLTGGIDKSRVPLYLGNHDIFINTSNIDNAPISVIEAMAVGLCVVSTDVGGISHLLTHLHDSILVPANDPEAMARAIRSLLDEPEMTKRISNNARVKAEQFDWSILLPKWESVLIDDYPEK